MEGSLKEREKERLTGWKYKQWRHLILHVSSVEWGWVIGWDRSAEVMVL